MIPRITTVIPTYNQEGYIATAIESAVSQIGRFDHEILVSSDGSTDGTRSIIAEWCRRHPGLVKDVSPQENLGISRNFKSLFSQATGDYIAILEGDDIWTDHEKLVKQLSFLQSKADCVMVFSKIVVKKLPSGEESFLPRQERLKDLLDGSDFLADPSMNLIANFSSCLFDGNLLRAVPERLYRGRFNEIALAFYLERHGKIGFISEPMSVYHQHAAGVWTGSSREQQLRAGLATREMVLDVADERYHTAIENIIQERYRKPLSTLG